MDEWSFLTKHARVLVCIAQDPGVRLRDIAGELGITERSAFAIVSDLTAAGYVVKDKEGRRNRYEIQGHLPMNDIAGQERTIGEVLQMLVDPTVPVLAQGSRRNGSGQPRRGTVRHKGAAPVTKPSPTKRLPARPRRERD
jgi:DNA-binding IscR family transcriptional regulator